MNFFRKGSYLFSDCLTSPFECCIFGISNKKTLMINLQKTMENENDFRIRTYTKRELACLYCPNTTARCAIRTLTRWIKRNNELYAELLLTGYHARVRTFMPRQVGIIVRYLNEP